MYIYSTRYGKGGNSSTPQFMRKGNELYLTSQNKTLTSNNRAAAMYKIVGNSVYQTNFHPDGKSLHPVYEIKRNGFYRTLNHKEGFSSVPDFKLQPRVTAVRTAPTPSAKSVTKPAPVAKPVTTTPARMNSASKNIPIKK